MRHPNRIILISFLALFSQASLATDSYYLSMSYGITSYDSSLSNPTGTAKLEEESNSSRLLVGVPLGIGGLIGEVYMADMGGISFTANSGDTVDVDGTTVTIPIDGYRKESENIVGGFNFVYKFDVRFGYLTAKAGAMYWLSTTKTTVNGAVTEEEEKSNVNALAGLGYEFPASKMLSIRLEYEYSQIDDDPVSNISLGVFVGF